jgi:hypothetical protein
MYAYLKKNTRTTINLDAEESEERNEDAPPQPSSRTKYKQAKKKTQASMGSFVASTSVTTKPTTQKQSNSKSVGSMLCKTPREFVAERHKGNTSQSTFEHCTKKGKEAKQVVDDHGADFVYENKIPLNVINSRS